MELINKMSIKEYFLRTAKRLKNIDKKQIAEWFLNEGYYPEYYVLPPCFQVVKLELNKKPYYNLKKLEREKIITISHPKSLLTSRIYGIIHPMHYHDIVYHIIRNWNTIVNHIFRKNLKIFSYSFPIQIDKKSEGGISNLRTGRMIYEWIKMAEKDLIAESYKYNFLIHADITNFYNSIYTHSISWALHGRDRAFKDKNKYKYIGTKIDKLAQYANDARTSGIPVGPAISDLIAEIILARVDRAVSKKLNKIDFIGTRFKDDYRILCNSEEDAKKILKVLSEELFEYNLIISEQKTKIHKLPDGLYRQHIREYHFYSLKDKEKITFKDFELTLLKVLDIHKTYPGTSILEKFFSELYDNDNKGKEKNLKIQFSSNNKNKDERYKQILKAISLLMLVKRESPKTLCYVLAICEEIYIKYHESFRDLKQYMENLLKSEIKKASDKKSVFELVWLVFFYQYLNLDAIDFSEFIDKELIKNEFLKSVISNEQIFFNKYKDIQLFQSIKYLKPRTLSKRLAIFRSDK